MFLKNLLVIAAALLGLSSAQPLTRQETNPLLTAGYVEGDMVLNTTSRNGLRDPVYRWPNNIFYYKFDSSYDQYKKNYVLYVMRIIESVSCIRFKEANDSIKHFVFMTNKPDGCYAHVGYIKIGRQIFNLANNCFYLGAITHELLHSLGFHHMQNAANRDEYVRILEENIKPKFLFAFTKYDKNLVYNYGEEYDYYSIMHYTSDAFSVNGKPTIIPLKPGFFNIIGRQSRMSKRDIKKLNAMYRCYTKI